MAVHAAAAILLAMSASLLDPCTKTIALRFVPGRSARGRSFGVMGAVAGSGSAIGNLIGTRLYSAEKIGDVDAAVGRRARHLPLLPFVLCAGLFLCAALLLLLLHLFLLHVTTRGRMFQARAVFLETTDV